MTYPEMIVLLKYTLFKQYSTKKLTVACIYLYSACNKTLLSLTDNIRPCIRTYGQRLKGVTDLYDFKL